MEKNCKPGAHEIGQKLNPIKCSTCNSLCEASTLKGCTKCKQNLCPKCVQKEADEKKKLEEKKRKEEEEKKRQALMKPCCNHEHKMLPSSKKDVHCGAYAVKCKSGRQYNPSKSTHPTDEAFMTCKECKPLKNVCMKCYNFGYFKQHVHSHLTKETTTSLNRQMWSCYICAYDMVSGGVPCYSKENLYECEKGCKFYMCGKCLTKHFS